MNAHFLNDKMGDLASSNLNPNAQEFVPNCHGYSVDGFIFEQIASSSDSEHSPLADTYASTTCSVLDICDQSEEHDGKDHECGLLCMSDEPMQFRPPPGLPPPVRPPGLGPPGVFTRSLEMTAPTGHVRSLNDERESAHMDCVPFEPAPVLEPPPGLVLASACAPPSTLCDTHAPAKPPGKWCSTSTPITTGAGFASMTSSVESTSDTQGQHLISQVVCPPVRHLPCHPAVVTTSETGKVSCISAKDSKSFRVDWSVHVKKMNGKSDCGLIISPDFKLDLGNGGALKFKILLSSTGEKGGQTKRGEKMFKNAKSCTVALQCKSPTGELQSGASMTYTTWITGKDHHQGPFPCDFRDKSSSQTPWSFTETMNRAFKSELVISFEIRA